MATDLTVFIPSVFRPIDKLLGPARAFFRIEASGGILLLASTIFAVAWANSPWAESYYALWHKTYINVAIGSVAFHESLSHFVNDGLMVIFFFVVGLEIKREMLVGELASFQKAALPIAAAVGGMAVPAIIYAIINAGQESIRGWAIPCATDIAFALGIMAMLGKRVPLQLKVFLTAVAIVDDIGAVLIIALFYTSDMSFGALGVATAALLILVLLNVLGVRNSAVYIVLGLILWYAIYRSGIHATIAGVLLAFTIPSKFRIHGADFVSFSRTAVDEFEKAGGGDNDVLTNADRQRWVRGLEAACERVQTPLSKMEYYLHPWSAYLIVPIFAIANAGVTFDSGFLDAITTKLSLGIVLGLILGKQIGIMLFAAVAQKLGFGALPAGITWKHIYATSWLAGIGFTMSLFIANLGFGAGDLLETAKMGVLAASLVAGVIGFFILRFVTAPQK